MTFLDSQVGVVLTALREAGLTENTRILYLDDHGDSAGEHGLFFKSTMNEGSVRIPLIAAGPGIPCGKRIAKPVSIVDIYPTLLDFHGLKRNRAEEELPGISLMDTLAGKAPKDRCIYSEYHAAGFPGSVFMLRKGDYKLIRYIGHEQCQLFDLGKDPEENHDLGGLPEYRPVAAELNRDLEKICDPEATICLAYSKKTSPSFVITTPFWVLPKIRIPSSVSSLPICTRRKDAENIFQRPKRKVMPIAETKRYYFAEGARMQRTEYPGLNGNHRYLNRTFYHFFPSKEDLILAIMKDSQDHLTRRFQELYQLHGAVRKSDFISLYYQFFIEDKTNVFQYLSRDDLTALLLRSDHSVSFDSVRISITENLEFLAHPKKNINLNAIINFTQLVNLCIENKDLLVKEELSNTIKKLLENLADEIFEEEPI